MQAKDTYCLWCNIYCYHLQNIVMFIAEMSMSMRKYTICLWYLVWWLFQIHIFLFRQWRIFYSDNTRKLSVFNMIILLFLMWQNMYFCPWINAFDNILLLNAYEVFNQRYNLLCSLYIAASYLHIFACTSKVKQTTKQLSDLFIHSKQKGRVHNSHKINLAYSLR